MPKTKRLIIREWRAASARKTENSDGLADADMIPWCKKLNRLPGICTLQSCAGHGGVAPGHIVSCGHIWLYLDERVSAAFNAKAFVLSCQPNIERVYRLYSHWGQEIACVEFLGNERGELAHSMGAIHGFLKTLTPKPSCNPQRHL